jgi:hypothetical protein
VNIVVNEHSTDFITSSHGQFSFMGLRGGVVDVVISLSGYQSLVKSFILADNLILNIGELELLPEGTIEASSVSGVVLSSKTNMPLSGVEVQGVFSSREVSVFTNDAGFFEFTDLVDLEGELVFHMDSYISVDFALRLTDFDYHELGQIRLRPEGLQELIPDLKIINIYTDSINTDLRTLQIEGDVEVIVRNVGSYESTVPFRLFAFYDVDNDGFYTSNVDRNLGEIDYTEGVLVDEDIRLLIPLIGDLPFLDAPINIWVDSENSVIEIDEVNNYFNTGSQCFNNELNCSLFDTQFNDVDVENSWLNWIDGGEILDSWNVSDGVYNHAISPSGGGVILKDLEFTDYVVETSIRFPKYASEFSGLLIKYENINNWYKFQVKSGEARILRNSDGVIETISYDDSVKIQSDRWYQLRVKVEDGKIESYVDDNLLFDVTDSSIDSGGLGYVDEGGDVQYDNLCVSPISEPIVKWHWKGSSLAPGSNAVFGPPNVGQLTDDNGDGVVNFNDIPDLVFLSSRQGTVLNAVSGLDGSEIWSTNEYPLSQLGSSAMGDIDGDSLMEIIVVEKNRREIFAFEHDGTLKWRVPTGLFWSKPPRDGIALADLDGDGSSEIIHGRNVFNSDGTLLWRGAGGDGDNRWYGFLPVVADVDLDGSPEVIAGNTLYNSRGDTVWIAQDVKDGFSGVGNFDNDDYAEIVLVASGRVYLLEHTGEIIWGPVGIPGGGYGGAPTIADFDGDGEPEIGVAGARNYVAYETDGSIKWTSETQDVSSNRTGSSVFDFESDGRVEILYADETKFRIYDGREGKALFEIDNISGTTLEYPVVADVDGDNRAEIVLTSTSGITTGVRILEASDDSWANTRGIWNQHTYHINNISENGTIPIEEIPSWLTHNTFRLNAFIDDDGQGLPDLTISLLDIQESDLVGNVGLSARIGNAGAFRSPGSVNVKFYKNTPYDLEQVIAEYMLPRINPGEFFDLKVESIEGISSGDEIIAIIDPAVFISECCLDNNRMSILAQGELGDIDLALEGSIFGSNTVISLQTTISNLGALEGDYSYDIKIYDAYDDLVSTVVISDVLMLPASESILVDQSWDTGRVIAGEYKTIALLRNANGQMLSSSEVSFVVSDIVDPDGSPSDVALVSLTPTTDSVTYHFSDRVNLNVLIKNITDIHPLIDTQLEIVVINPEGLVIYDESIPQPYLNPGSLVKISRSLTLSEAPTGVYQYNARLVGLNGVIVEGSVEFGVTSSPILSLSGNVDAVFEALYKGETQVCNFTALNMGTDMIPSVELKQYLINIDEESVLSTIGQSIELSSLESFEKIHSYETNLLQVGSYACVLEATLGDDVVVLDTSIFKIDIPSIQSAISSGAQGRLLVLTDAPRQCSAFEDIRLGAEFGAELSLNNEITVRLLNEDGVVFDTEIISAFDVDINNSYGTPTEPDLAVKASASGELEFVLTKSGGMPHHRYQVQVEVKKSWFTSIEKSWSIDSTCDRPLTIGELYEDLTLLDWDIWTNEYDLREIDPYGPSEGPGLNAQNDFIEGLLGESGWEYTLVHTAEEFAYEHRKGDYGSYLIMSERPQLHWKVQKEIREAVVAGKGLIVAGSYDKRNHWLEPALGMDVVGYHPWARELNVNESSITGEQQLPLVYDDRVQGIWLDGAGVIGEYTLAADQSEGWTWLDQHSFVIGDIFDFKRKAITQYEYGDGKSLFFGFDLLIEATSEGANGAYSTLLLDSLAWIQPDENEVAYPFSVVPVNVEWVNNRGAVEVYAELQTTGGASIAAASGFDNNTPASATFNMEEGEVRNQTIYVELSEEPSQQVSVITTTMDGDQRTVQAEASFDLLQTERPSLSETQAELDSLAWQYWYRVEYRSAWLKFKLARSAFEAGYYNEAQGLFLIAADLLMDRDEPEVIAARKSLNSHIETTGRHLALDQ